MISIPVKSLLHAIWMRLLVSISVDDACDLSRTRVPGSIVDGMKYCNTAIAASAVVKYSTIRTPLEKTQKGKNYMW